MTNKLITIVIFLQTVTNWTDFKVDDKNFGYVTTNHIAQITYQGTNYTFTLKTELSNVAVWKTNELVPWIVKTNQWATNYWIN